MATPYYTTEGGFGLSSGSWNISERFRVSSKLKITFGGFSGRHFAERPPPTSAHRLAASRLGGERERGAERHCFPRLSSCERFSSRWGEERNPFDWLSRSSPSILRSFLAVSRSQNAPATIQYQIPGKAHPLATAIQNSHGISPVLTPAGYLGRAPCKPCCRGFRTRQTAIPRPVVREPRQPAQQRLAVSPAVPRHHTRDCPATPRPTSTIPTP